MDGLCGRHSASARWKRRVVVLIVDRLRAITSRAGYKIERLPRDVWLLGNPAEFFRNVGWRKNQVHAARAHGAARHRVELGRIILRERDPTLGLDRLKP